ncbi:MAG: YdeI/OmpD-associated family protein [Pseudonocardiales bacterium]
MTEQAVFRFRTTLKLAGKTATGIEVPLEVVAGLGAGKRPPVRVTIAGHTYRSTVAVMGGVHLVGVSAEHRAAAGVAAGDEVDVELVLDTEPREVSVPADLAAALDADPAARQAFDALSYSNRLRYALAVGAAKKPETRERRLTETLDALRNSRAG